MICFVCIIGSLDRFELAGSVVFASLDHWIGLDCYDLLCLYHWFTGLSWIGMIYCVCIIG